MRNPLPAIALLLALLPAAGGARTLEVEVYGMTCAFCVDSLQRAFGKIDSVREVRISLERKRLRLLTSGELPSDETIRQTILDAGFTPIRIIDLSDGE